MPKKDAFYFQHDYNARNDDKILELRAKYGAEGYGIFWMILETMADNDCGGAKATLIGGLSLGYGVAKELIKEIFIYCTEIGLFHEEGGVYYSKRLQTHREYRAELSKNGSAGAGKKWANYRDAMAGLKGGFSPPYAKERKGKEIKGISFNEEKNAVIFPDGSTQELGKSQKLRIMRDDIEPKEIWKGYVV